MLKWKRVEVTAAVTTEKIESILAGMSGKNRVIKYLGASGHYAEERYRVYRDADQIVDLDGNMLTDEAPFLPMDLSLAEGQLCNVGFYNGFGSEQTRIIAIGYTEAD
ncbi:hypothetical protein ES703_16688 [subsurface metagenome]